MSRSDKSAVPGNRRLALGAALSVAALFGLLLPLMLDAPANAASVLHASGTTCPTDPYTHQCISSGSSTTAAATAHLTLTISYAPGSDGGIVTWQACGFPASATGTTAQLYLNGVAQTQSGGSGAILSNGCTTDPSFPVCLPSGTFEAVANDPSASLTATETPLGALAAVVITSSTCLTAASTAPSTLAFTGTNVLRLLLIALALIAIGFVIVRLNRQRRRAD
jgi:hypothetical protein